GGRLRLVVVEAATLGAQRQAGRIATAPGDIVDGAAQCHGTVVESVAAPKNLGVFQAEGLEQLVGGAAGSGERQAGEVELGSGAEEAGAAVDSRAADRDFQAIATLRGLCKYARLEREDVGSRAYAPFLEDIRSDEADTAGNIGQFCLLF